MDTQEFRRVGHELVDWIADYFDRIEDLPVLAAIEPEYQQQGVARQLVNECLSGLRKLGLQRALILVASDNPDRKSVV